MAKIMNAYEASNLRDIILQYLSNNKIEEGIAIFKKRCGEFPEPFRFECLGNISFYQRDIGQAIKFYETATLLSPEHVIARYLYLAGVKNEREKNFVDAFKYYQAAIEAEPSFVDSYIELGGLLMKVGDFNGALTCYEDSVRLDHQEPANHENLKAVLTKLNQDQPGYYEERLRSVTAVYEKIIRDSKSSPLSEHHHW
jgi:tetratricopeptide (TPR) repeat protein